MPNSTHDRFTQVLLDEGPEGLVLVESKMERGSTHDKDKTKMTKLVDADNLTRELEDLREAQELDMQGRRMFQPKEMEQPSDS